MFDAVDWTITISAIGLAFVLLMTFGLLIYAIVMTIVYGPPRTAYQFVKAKIVSQNSQDEENWEDVKLDMALDGAGLAYLAGQEQPSLLYASLAPKNLGYMMTLAHHRIGQGYQTHITGLQNDSFVGYESIEPADRNHTTRAHHYINESGDIK
jgi:hypothetical protein